MKKYFHYTKFVIVMTLFAVCIFIICLVFLLQDEVPLVMQLMFGSFIGLVVLSTVMFAPVYYIKTDEGVQVRTLCFKFNFPAEKYQIENYETNILKSLRLFGSGGFFGFFGLFTDHELGNYWLISAGERRHFIKLTRKADGKNILVAE